MGRNAFQDEQRFPEVCCVAAGMSALARGNTEKELQDTMAVAASLGTSLCQI